MQIYCLKQNLILRRLREALTDDWGVQPLYFQVFFSSLFYDTVRKTDSGLEFDRIVHNKAF